MPIIVVGKIDSNNIDMTVRIVAMTIAVIKRWREGKSEKRSRKREFWKRFESLSNTRRSFAM